MSLNSDEKELVDSVMDACEDYYPPLLALMFYRYNRIATNTFLPTEEIQFLATQAFFDLNEHSAEQQKET